MVSPGVGNFTTTYVLKSAGVNVLPVSHPCGHTQMAHYPPVPGSLPPHARANCAAPIACPRCRCVCSAMCTNSPITVVGKRFRPTQRGSASVAGSIARMVSAARRSD